MNSKSDADQPFEVTIYLKGEEQSYRKKHLCYHNARISQEDEIIKDFIEDAKKECRFDIEEIRVKASF